MWYRAKPRLPLPADSSSELEKLTATVAKWGKEAGFLGLEDRLEPRLLAMVREAAARLFGTFEADSGRLRSELDAVESEWDQEAHRVAAYRSRFGVAKGTDRLLTRLRLWLWDYR